MSALQPIVPVSSESSQWKQGSLHPSDLDEKKAASDDNELPPQQLEYAPSQLEAVERGGVRLSWKTKLPVLIFVLLLTCASFPLGFSHDVPRKQESDLPRPLNSNSITSPAVGSNFAASVRTLH